MKKYIILFLILTGLGAHAQKLEKYEDVLPSILALPPSGALAQLKIYLAEEPDNASIYLQMAVIYETRYKNSDPIKDYAYKVGNAREALKAYAITERFITEKDVRKNEEHYFNFGQLDDKGRVEVEYDTISSHMAAMKEELQSFIDHAPTIYEKFTKSFSSYDRAHKKVSAILGQYTTFKDLYLLYGPEVDAQFEEIKTAYQNCLSFWEEYKAATQQFDIGYNQTLDIQPVKVYRLDGLESKINFLQDKVHIWDYAQWVDATREAINTEIDKLRTDLSAENIRLNQRLEQATPDFIRDQFEPLRVSKEVLFQLRKYDLNSVVEPIFLYKAKKHELIYQQLQSNQIDTTASADESRKLYLYGQMINRIKEADTLLANIDKKNTQESFEKYTDFIRMHYQNQSGIVEFAQTERNENQETKGQYVSQIRSRLVSLLAADSLVEEIKHKRMEIPLNEQLAVDYEQLTADPITTHRFRNFDESQFIGGILKNEDEGKVQAYVAGITADNKVGWYNDYLLQIDSTAGYDSHTRVGAMQVIPGGLAVILHGTDTNNTHINHLLLLDEQGKPTLSRRLLLNQYPRTITYNERTNSLLVTYKGEDYISDIFQQSEMIIASYSILGDLQWQQRMSYKGEITSVTNLDDGYLVVGNFNELKGLDGKIQRAGNQNTDTKIFALKVQPDGALDDLKTIASVASSYSTITYKVSDDCINLFGMKGPYEKLLSITEEPEHIIITKDLEVLASSL
ncbi:hypothetical protein [Marinoscillum furvescens]|uniref:Uncharacterized protein n=1 Tax=Marinoscillum furvescens DSM 4134 TaxID=1122208 RepID=A0A3D9L618_MARFU|nr:hypothetical protein [Marinoscillum furvescens]REE00524.1 hypothetical protein C7460_105147 [Marinoscillum furvescens DSM 4134]